MLQYSLNIEYPYITFTNLNNSKSVKINVAKEFPTYCCDKNVLSSYYRENTSGEIVRIPGISKVIIKEGNNIYTRISQFELDKYEYDSGFTDSDNSKIYSYLLEKIGD